MTLALQLAEQGLYTTTPNPRVGCVIVKNHQIIGQGAHLKAGEPHAEVLALRKAGTNAKGADVYVTLEPCNHHGRTPPCVDALIQAGVGRVVVAMQDPNPLVAGNGIQRLQANGIQVEVGLMASVANALNIGFVSRMTRGLPYVRCKVAASLDGKTALNNGKSQWITSDPARQDVQHWRAQSCAIMTGIGTVLADNPSMTVRLPNTTRQPLRVIVDGHLQTPADAKLLQNGQTLIAYASDPNHQVGSLNAAGADCLHLPDKNARVDLKALLANLAQRGINEVLLEAGQGLNGAFLQAGLIDEFIFYYAPKLMGADAKGMFAMPAFTKMQQAIDLQIFDVRQVGADIRVRAKPTKTA
ncbi:MAG TPA: bifunctional diaminohydroxyphosphoribosylaminopyrimidine deaminase/5-amino-6-(5-phosphoribosylamino)uracil reductase RibD [Methylophilaceae bacterium]|nr:bifunctional diaminohydroxyphosphoribosylaminopyrimidine deaminase/5-amino-6-(5-phosphoribosylamino)uracil reductase RibD [Methylophilaceae bacterium]HQC28338.1 bifunctional diaminohydroxyphosphoribosylaminopyrimidine deaminase/5-amino-6-(5-phosphoribosylamino)uracil reductase RibD [Methylotenera sp.]